MTQPSERVHDVYRRKNGGKVDMSTNSKPGFDNFHVDRSRLGVHEEYDREAPNDWGGKGKFVEKPNNIRLNAVAGMGDIRFKSSNRNPGNEQSDTGAGPRCDPTLYPPWSKNPIYRKRGDD